MIDVIIVMGIRMQNHECSDVENAFPIFKVSRRARVHIIRVRGKVYIILYSKFIRKTIRTKFHQTRPSFVEDITKKTFRSLFPDTVNIYLYSP